jgi:hypothetical protein
MKSIIRIICLVLIGPHLRADESAEILQLAAQIREKQQQLTALLQQKAKSGSPKEAFDLALRLGANFENSPRDNALATAGSLLLARPELLRDASKDQIDILVALLRPRIDGVQNLSGIIVSSCIQKESKEGILVPHDYYWGPRNVPFEEASTWMTNGVARIQDRLAARMFLERLLSGAERAPH